MTYSQEGRIHLAKWKRCTGTECPIRNSFCELCMHLWTERMCSRSIRAMLQREICELPLRGWIDVSRLATGQLSRNEVSRTHLVNGTDINDNISSASPVIQPLMLKPGLLRQVRLAEFQVNGCYAFELLVNHVTVA